MHLPSIILTTLALTSCNQAAPRSKSRIHVEPKHQIILQNPQGPFVILLMSHIKAHEPEVYATRAILLNDWADEQGYPKAFKVRMPKSGIQLVYDCRTRDETANAVFKALKSKYPHAIFMQIGASPNKQMQKDAASPRL